MRSTYRFIWIMLLLLCPNAFSAQTEEQALSFGRFAIASNVGESTLKIPANGVSIVSTHKLYFISLGQPGHYRLSAYPAYTPLNITIDDFDLTQLGASEALLVRDFTFSPVITDINGEALIKLGATLKTTGNGTPYVDGPYSGALNIIINW